MSLFETNYILKRWMLDSHPSSSNISHQAVHTTLKDGSGDGNVLSSWLKKFDGEEKNRESNGEKEKATRSARLPRNDRRKFVHRKQ